MPTKDVFEGEDWPITIRPKSTAKKTIDKFKNKTVDVKIKGVPDGDVTEKVTLDAQASNTLNHTTKVVPDDKKFYNLKATVVLEKRVIVNNTEDIEETCKVWPKALKVAVVGLDDAAVEGVKLRAKQGTVNLTAVVTDDKGKGEFALKKNDDAVVLTADAPFEIVEQKPVSGKPREIDVKVKRTFKTKFVKISDYTPTPPTNKAVIKSYVNLGTRKHSTGAEVWGSELEFTVGVYDDTDPLKPYTGTAGDIVYIKVTFGRESDRDDPAPELSGTAGKVTKAANGTKKNAIQTGQVELADDSGAMVAKFKVNLGLAGGDTCKIQLSHAKDGFASPTVAELNFQNWRYLWIDNLEPVATVSTFCLRKFGGGGLSGAQKTALRTQLGTDKAFIELLDGVSHTYAEADLPGNGLYNVYPSEHVGLTAGGKVVLLTESQLRDMSGAKRGGVKDRSWYVTWADSAFIEAANPSLSFDLETATEQLSGAVGQLYAYDPVKADGTLGVKSLKWRCVEYDDGGWKPLSDGNPGAPIAAAITKFTDEETVNALTAWRTIDCTDKALVDSYIALPDFRTVDITLPTANAVDAGNFLVKDGTKLKVRIFVEFNGATSDTNAAALQGEIWMGCMLGQASSEGIVEVLLHEMGHNMGLGYGKNNKKDVGGHTGKPVGGVPFETLVPKGDYYAGRDHTGGHCAAGLSNDDKKKKSFAPLRGTCAMWGSADMSSTAIRNFCDKCLKYMKALDMTSISKSW